MSHERANSNPPPRAAPSTTAIVGTSITLIKQQQIEGIKVGEMYQISMLNFLA
jgi:hypothetical protein